MYAALHVDDFGAVGKVHAAACDGVGAACDFYGLVGADVLLPIGGFEVVALEDDGGVAWAAWVGGVGYGWSCAAGVAARACVFGAAFGRWQVFDAHLLE